MYQAEIRYLTSGNQENNKKSFKDLLKVEKMERFVEKDDEIEEGE